LAGIGGVAADVGGDRLTARGVSASGPPHPKATSAAFRPANTSQRPPASSICFSRAPLVGLWRACRAHGRGAKKSRARRRGSH